MANRFPLVVDTSDSNKIKEIPSGDNLQLSANSIIGVVNITGSGTLTIESISATNITKGGTPLATVATSGSYADLSNKPTNISLFTNDAGYVTSGSNISLLNNNAGYLTSVAFDDLTSTPTTLSGYGITDAATSAQGTKADSALQPGNNISTLLNDAGYITLANIQNGDVTVDVNNTGDLIGSVFGQDSTILVDAILSSINTTGTIRGHTTPHVSGVYDLGSFTNRFRDAYINGQVKTTNIYSQDDADLTIAGASIDSVTDGNDIVIAAGANTGFGNGGNVLINAGASSGGSTGEIRIGETTASSVGIRNTNVVIGKAGGITNIYGDIVFREEVNFSNATNIVGFTGDVTGSVFADDSTALVDGVNGKIVGDVENITINTQNIRSSNTSTGNLLLQGSSTNAGNGGTITIWGGVGFGTGNGGFVNIDAGNASGSGTKGGINIGTSSTATSSVTIGLPSQSSIIVSNDDDSVTINGNVDLSNATSITGFTGDVTGSIFADDSTLLVDGVNGTIPSVDQLLSDLKALVASSPDFATFKAAIAGL